MQRLFVLTGSLAACMLVATVVQAVTIGFGQSNIAKAGAGCVGGWISAHGNTAYFRGDTDGKSLRPLGDPCRKVVT